jgi:hypothetical protein
MLPSDTRVRPGPRPRATRGPDHRPLPLQHAARSCPLPLRVSVPACPWARARAVCSTQANGNQFAEPEPDWLWRGWPAGRIGFGEAGRLSGLALARLARPAPSRQSRWSQPWPMGIEWLKKHCNISWCAWYAIRRVGIEWLSLNHAEACASSMLKLACPEVGWMRE